MPPADNCVGYEEAVGYLYGRIDYERIASNSSEHEFRLDRTAELFRSLGLTRYLHPSYRTDAENADRENQTTVPIVHVAGTKGKGSTTTMVSSILAAAGIKAGLYTSPHLTRLNERFRINGNPCSDEDLVRLVERVKPVVEEFDRLGQGLSFFELTTALAVLHFDLSGCDAIVLEVGLGGRLDSTNVCHSTVTAITSIGLDHQHVLGNTLEEIAREKAGIIKPSVPVVCGVRDAGPFRVIQEIAEQHRCSVLHIEDDFAADQIAETQCGTRFTYLERDAGTPNPKSKSVRSQKINAATESFDVDLPLIGRHQADNASVAITICRTLQQTQTFQERFAMLHERFAMHGTLLSSQAMQRGLDAVRCAGRLEKFVLPEDAFMDDFGTTLPNPTKLILDTAHNPDSIAALCSAIKSRVTNSTADAAMHRPIVLVFGTSRDKDVHVMAAQLVDVVDHVICTQYQTNPRAMPSQTVHDAFDQAKQNLTTERQISIEVEPNPNHALAIAAVRATDENHARPNSNLLATERGTVIVCGSFYLAGELRDQIVRRSRKPCDQIKLGTYTNRDFSPNG